MYIFYNFIFLSLLINTIKSLSYNCLFVKPQDELLPGVELAINILYT